MKSERNADAFKQKRVLQFQESGAATVPHAPQMSLKNRTIQLSAIPMPVVGNVNPQFSTLSHKLQLKFLQRGKIANGE